MKHESLGAPISALRKKVQVRTCEKAAIVSTNQQMGALVAGETKPLVVLIGPAGVGKSTIGKLLATELGSGFLDTDKMVEAGAGKSIPAIFAEAGEPEFRRLEAQAVADGLRGFPGVLALGGGAVMTDSNAQALTEYVAQGGEIVYLTMDIAAAKPRIASGDRPLLASAHESEALERWQALHEGRAATYARLASITIDTSNLTPAEIVAAVKASLSNANSHGVKAPAIGEAPAVSVSINTADPYNVLIGKGIINQLAQYLPTGVKKILLIRPEPLEVIAQRVISALTNAGYEVVEQIVPDGEAQKTSEVAAECWATAGKAAITRSDAIVAVGGGATTDLGGFIAATWLRGIAVVQVATTLLAMVDAAVGGKTGINTAEGKNLVGAFHQPAAVFCDLEFLETLPARDFTAGLGEVVKYGLISDKEILGLIENNAAELNPWKGAQTDAKTWQVVEELVRRAVAVKAEVTSGDPTEKGVREFLNYGHTLGHAIEHGEHFTWRHGEAVAVGMVFAAELAALAGLLTAAEVARHRALLTAVGLPVRYSKKTLADLLPAMGRDKKTRGNRMRFIVLDGIGNPTRLVAPDQDSLEKAFQNIAQPC